VTHWAQLGLARTDDAGEIRRAYARKLKTIDVDTDPQAFVALREALNQALWDAEDARWQAQEDARDTEEDAQSPDPADTMLVDLPREDDRDSIWRELEYVAAHEDGASPLPPPADDRDAPGQAAPNPEAAAQEERNARFAALERLLFPGENAPPADPDALDVAMRAILDHPDMETIDHSARVEAWLADALYHAIPNSDPIIDVAIDRFGWTQRLGNWDQPWILEALVRRRESFRFMQDVATPGHALHKAWRDLQSDRESLGLFTIGRRGEVERLLGAIRRDYPDAEAALNPHRVALWEERLGGGVKSGLTWAMFIFWGLFILAKIIAAVDGPSSTTPPSPVSVLDQRSAYSDPETDLAPYLDEASLGRLDLDMIAERNPPLHGRLLERWERARDGRGLDYLFAQDIRTLLEQAARQGLRGGGYEVQASYWRLHRDRIAWRRSVGVEDCDGRNPGPTPRAPPPEFDERLRTLMAQALAAAPVDAPPLDIVQNRRFTIPASVVETVARQTGLEGAALSDALLSRGPPARNCSVSIALIDAALALPRRQGARLLNDMSAGL
jgi:hypothetical protein